MFYTSFEYFDVEQRMFTKHDNFTEVLIKNSTRRAGSCFTLLFHIGCCIYVCISYFIVDGV